MVMVFHLFIYILLTFHSIQGFTHSRSTCEFDSDLSGKWFQSGRGNVDVIVNRTHFSNGKCVEVGKGNRYLVYLPHEKCHKCMVINKKHHNVIQYKESFCDPRTSAVNIVEACHGITGDATLYTMFRLNTMPVKCPFTGPMKFTYSKGYGECADPLSQVDSCADETRLLFRQQACPDIPKSESREEELLCLAVWKDGSNKYLAGKINHSHANTDEDRYRCFIFEKPNHIRGRQYRQYPVPVETSDKWHLSMSADATCQGLVSAYEGSITMKLKKDTQAGIHCRFPSWFLHHKQWHTLDFKQSYFLYHKNSSFKISNITKPSIRDHADLKFVCHHYEQYYNAKTNKMHSGGKKSNHDHADKVTLVVHFTQGCRSGYKCMSMYRRDEHVVQVQIGHTAALTPDEACSSYYWQPAEENLITLLSNKEDSISCGPLGKYSIVNNEPCKNEGPNFSKLSLGCSSYDTLQLYSQCPQENVDTYQCHSQWESNQVTYIIASPHSRASGAPKRVCFSYRTNKAGDSTDAKVIFTTRHDSCISRMTDAHLTLNATLIGQCAQASGISSGGPSSRPFYSSLVLLVVSCKFVCDFFFGGDQVR